MLRVFHLHLLMCVTRCTGGACHDVGVLDGEFVVDHPVHSVLIYLNAGMGMARFQTSEQKLSLALRLVLYNCLRYCGLAIPTGLRIVD